jgi:hypothetical protein
MRRGDTGPQVRRLQESLEQISPELYTGVVDGDFGKLTHNAVLQFQQYRLIGEDGIVGPETHDQLRDALTLDWAPGVPFTHPQIPVLVYGPWHPKLSWLPDTALGRVESADVSWFGGPNDKYDRVYGQAYISGSRSPTELIQKHPELVKMGILRREVSLFADYPMVTDWKDRNRRAGTSWALDPESFYCAMRFRRRGPRNYRNAGNPRLLVWSLDRLKACTVLRTDWGPRKKRRMEIDLSPGALHHLGLRTHNHARVCWAVDNAQLGPVHYPTPEVLT